MRDTPYDIPSLADGSLEQTEAITGSIANELNRLLLIIRNCGQFLRAEIEDSGPSRVYLNELLAAAERGTRIAAQLHAVAQSHVHREPPAEPRVHREPSAEPHVHREPSAEPRRTLPRMRFQETEDAFPRPMGASPKP